MCFEENAAKETTSWDESVQVRAQELLSQFTLGKQTINSLAFKTALRDVMGPDVEIVQKDTSAFLHRWFFGEGGNAAYDTVRNGQFITYAPKLTDDQKALDAAMEKQLATSRAESGNPVAVGVNGKINAWVDKD